MKVKMVSKRQLLSFYALCLGMLCCTLFTQVNGTQSSPTSPTGGSANQYTGPQLKNILNKVKTLFNVYACFVDVVGDRYPPLLTKFDSSQNVSSAELHNWVKNLLGYYGAILRQEIPVDYLIPGHRQQIINALQAYLNSIGSITNNNEIIGKDTLQPELNSLLNAI